MKREVKLFISYAHMNNRLATSFLERIEQHLKASKRFQYQLWIDKGILCGQDWKTEIDKQLSICDAALLLLSPAFLNSTFAIKEELPILKTGGKLIFPVALHQLDFAYHDLQGIEEKQIFYLHSKDFNQPRSYYELKDKRREEFALALFRQIEDRLVRELTKEDVL